MRDFQFRSGSRGSNPTGPSTLVTYHTALRSSRWLPRSSIRDQSLVRWTIVVPAAAASETSPIRYKTVELAGGRFRREITVPDSRQRRYAEVERVEQAPTLHQGIEVLRRHL